MRAIAVLDLLARRRSLFCYGGGDRLRCLEILEGYRVGSENLFYKQGKMIVLC